MNRIEKAVSDQRAAGAGLVGMVESLLRFNAIPPHHVAQAQELVDEWNRAHEALGAALEVS